MNIIDAATTLPTNVEYVVKEDLLAYVSKQELSNLNVPLDEDEMDELFPLENNNQ